MGSVEGRRVLVVGASSGLGRAIADRLDRDGAAVAVAARRVDRLEAFANERDGRPCVVRCDVTDPVACVDAVAGAVDALGGLDALVYAPGLGTVVRLAKATPENWRQAFEVNVVGASSVTSAAIEELEASQGVAVYLSSVSANLTPPWMGMGIYAATKVALQKTVQVWQLEHPTVRFTTLVIGSTSGGEFFSSADIPFPEDTAAFHADWAARGYLANQGLEPGDQAQAVVDVLESNAQIDTMWVRPRTQFQL
jgi:NADP-dependent 3-hydroxy acid dehydrogenase YdfG